jgi:hypothetical protein
MPIPVNHDRPQFPDAELVEEPSIRSAIEEWNRAREAAREAERDWNVLEQGREQAESADRDRYADALQKGKGDPGTAATDKHDAKVLDAKRRAEALSIVESRAMSSMIKAIDENGDKWSKLAEERLAAVQGEWLEAIGVLNAKHAELSQAASVAAFTRSGRLKHGANTVQVRRDGVGVDELLAALRSLGERPAESQPAALRSVDQSAA